MSDHADSVNGAAQAEAEAPSMFPNTLHFNGATITMHADGSWSGDGETFLRAVGEARSGNDAITTAVIWFAAGIVREGLARRR